MMIEYEMKLPADIKRVQTKLQQIGAKFEKSEQHKDVYFNHPSRDFATTDEALRIRQKNNEVKLTYKGPKFDSRSKSRKELDLTIKDGDIEGILRELDFRESGIVKKNRDIWKYKEFTIVLDKVENLGEFVEIEFLSSEKNNLDLILNKIKDLAKLLTLNPEDQISRSYLELLFT